MEAMPNVGYCLPEDNATELNSLLGKMPGEFLWNGKIALNIPFVLIILCLSLTLALLGAGAAEPPVVLGLKRHSEQ